MTPLSPPEAAAHRAALLDWYSRHARDLPWRRDPRPWHVWVSEIMCQQTRVSSAIPYFERFIARFPTPAALAAVDIEAVYPYWAGLGYYARARNLHAAARQVAQTHDGEIPSDPEVFGALKGVGRYTRGAVMSIAFGHREPVVDGNVVRVLCRLLAVEADPRSAPVQRGLWASAAALVDGERPGDLNQAVMELGATVCTPKSPTCLLCPLQGACVARATGQPERLPVKPARKAAAQVALVAGLARDDAGALWLARNPDQGLLGGQWRLPGLPADDPQALTALGLTPTAATPLITVHHAFSHQRWTVAVYPARGTPRGGDFVEFRAVPEAALDGLPLGGPALKALRALGLKIKARRGAGR
ncbi:MAG: A/G-specific adenine glycosylase [Myxococcales bacterium]|nr:A/G-specific adenine glycosylase [Myxococcales bacterium]